jgi:hypothetical protein
MAGLGGAILAVAVGLVLMVGMFWVLDVLPLVAFVGLVVAYAVLSGRARPDGQSRH